MIDEHNTKLHTEPGQNMEKQRFGIIMVCIGEDQKVVGIDDSGEPKKRYNIYSYYESYFCIKNERKGGS